MSAENRRGPRISKRYIHNNMANESGRQAPGGPPHFHPPGQGQYVPGQPSAYHLNPNFPFQGRMAAPPMMNNGQPNPTQFYPPHPQQMQYPPQYHIHQGQHYGQQHHQAHGFPSVSQYQQVPPASNTVYFQPAPAAPPAAPPVAHSPIPQASAELGQRLRQPFNFIYHCLFCQEVLEHEGRPMDPNRWLDIHMKWASLGSESAKACVKANYGQTEKPCFVEKIVCDLCRHIVDPDPVRMEDHVKVKHPNFQSAWPHGNSPANQRHPVSFCDPMQSNFMASPNQMHVGMEFNGHQNVASQRGNTSHSPPVLLQQQHVQSKQHASMPGEINLTRDQGREQQRAFYGNGASGQRDHVSPVSSPDIAPAPRKDDSRTSSPGTTTSSSASSTTATYSAFKSTMELGEEVLRDDIPHMDLVEPNSFGGDKPSALISAANSEAAPHVVTAPIASIGKNDTILPTSKSVAEKEPVVEPILSPSTVQLASVAEKRPAETVPVASPSASLSSTDNGLLKTNTKEPSGMESMIGDTTDDLSDTQSLASLPADGMVASVAVKSEIRVKHEDIEDDHSNMAGQHNPAFVTLNLAAASTTSANIPAALKPANTTVSAQKRKPSHSPESLRVGTTPVLAKKLKTVVVATKVPDVNKSAKRRSRAVNEPKKIAKTKENVEKNGEIRGSPKIDQSSSGKKQPAESHRISRIYICKCGEVRTDVAQYREHWAQHMIPVENLTKAQQRLLCPRLNCGYLAHDDTDYGIHTSRHIFLQRTYRSKQQQAELMS